VGLASLADSPSGARGLSTSEAAERMASVGPNELPRPERPSLPRRLAHELLEPLVVLLLVAAVVSGAVLHELLDAVAIGAIVVLNAAIGLVEEGRATRALEALRELSAPAARVVRDGSLVEVPARGVVPGDLIVVGAGERVPADARLVTVEGLEVDESILTGESLPVGKDAGGPGDSGRIAAATSVTRGRATAVVTATGTATAVGRIAGALEERPPTPLQRELAGVARLLGLAAVAVAVGVLGLLLLRLGDSVTADEAFLTAVALAVAAVPEGLATVTAVALAIGVRHMADHGAIVRRLPAVETLGSTTVLVFDKTGTLTENRLRADGFAWVDGTAGEVDGTAGKIEALPLPVRDGVELVACLCSDTEPGEDGGDPVEVALLDAVGRRRAAGRRAGWPRVATVPFSSEQGWMGTGHRLLSADTASATLVTAKGAPEVVLPHCRVAVDAMGYLRPLDDGTRAALSARCDRWAADGAKVLALALAHGTTDVETTWRSNDLALVAVVALRDPVRSTGAASVEAVRHAGIRLVMATGDHPGTAGAIADAVDIDGSPAPAEVRTGAQIAAAGWPDDPAAVDAYARVTPDQKLELVHRLQARGEVVAMTGDGVNDAPALQAADIGVALGRSGTDVAREAADLVLTDDRLATMVDAVRRGRIIYDAIRRVVDYLVAGNLSEILLVVGVLLLRPDLGVPLLPLQLLWINLLTDGAPAVALGVDPVDGGVLDRPPRPHDQRLLDGRRWWALVQRGALLASAALVAATVGAEAFDLDDAATRTFALLVLVVAHLLYALVLAGFPRRGWLPVAVLGGLGLHVSAMLTPAGRTLLDLAVLPTGAWLAGAALACAPVGVLAITLRRRG
jgi:Ca2+-transporting ATPase